MDHLATFSQGAFATAVMLVTVRFVARWLAYRSTYHRNPSNWVEIVWF